MEMQRTVVPIVIAAIVAIMCTAGFLAMGIGGPEQEPPGLNMISASVIEKAGATVTPTDRD
jgi:hypothetical protein